MRQRPDVLASRVAECEQGLLRKRLDLERTDFHSDLLEPASAADALPLAVLDPGLGDCRSAVDS